MAYRLSTNVLVAVTTGWPSGVKVPFAVSFRRLLRLSSRLPVAVSLIFSFIVPAAEKVTCPEATRTGLALALERLAPGGS